MGKILNCKELAKVTREEIRNIVDRIKKYDNNDITLAIIQVGNNPASSTYVRNKTKACQEVGIKYIDYKYPDNIESETLIKLIQELNNSDSVHGILVQLPLPDHLNEEKILQTIDSRKDVDCFNYSNIGKLYTSNNAIFFPCTPAGILKILLNNDIQIEGKKCVVVGRSNIVGKPLAAMLMQKNATVTVAHSKTKNLKEVCKDADILISAIGKPKFITDEYIKNGAVIIDVGINRDENNKLCGDVDLEKVIDKCSAITPVPGGVGPMTITMLLKNCTIAYLNKEL